MNIELIHDIGKYIQQEENIPIRKKRKLPKIGKPKK